MINHSNKFESYHSGPMYMMPFQAIVEVITAKVIIVTGHNRACDNRACGDTKFASFLFY